MTSERIWQFLALVLGVFFCMVIFGCDHHLPAGYTDSGVDAGTDVADLRWPADYTGEDDASVVNDGGTDAGDAGDASEPPDGC